MKVDKNTNNWLVKFIRRIYVVAFNIYAWYWLYRLIFIKQSTFEDYLLWFFATAGMYFFVLDGKDVFLMDKSQKTYNNIEKI